MKNNEKQKDIRLNFERKQQAVDWFELFIKIVNFSFKMSILVKIYYYAYGHFGLYIKTNI